MQQKFNDNINNFKIMKKMNALAAFFLNNKNDNYYRK